MEWITAVSEARRARDPWGTGRKVGNNTTVRLVGNRAPEPAAALRFHATDIVTWYPDGAIDLDAWDSVTTRRRCPHSG